MFSARDAVFSQPVSEYQVVSTMDPFSALTIATSTAQFLEFGFNIVSGTFERYKSATGATASHSELEIVIGRLQDLQVTLQDSINTTYLHSSPEQLSYVHSLGEVVEKSLAVSTKLLQVLQDVKSARHHNLAGSLVATFKSCGKEKQIRSLHDQLLGLQTELQLCLMLIVGARQAESQDISAEILQHLQRVESCQSSFLVDQDLLSEDLKAARSQLQILDSLRYPLMRMRESNVSSAYSTTFDWILDPETSHVHPPRPGFRDWLSSDDRIYWITGKPGSGKSTLMKFLYTHPATKTALQHWAGDSLLVLSAHFFWTGGPEIQRSIDGLMLSLVEKVLTDAPQLIPVICPERWKQGLLQTREWTRGELLQCFETLSTQTEIPVKVCFFIDAIDEFEGNHQELLRILSSGCVPNSNIKVCLSSRERTFCGPTLGKQKIRSLRLQDYTRGDIQRYVIMRLGDSLGQLDWCDSDAAKESLVHKITSMADGVFLWVSLVCDELIKGSANQDSLAFMMKRVNSLPVDMEKYFTNMIKQIDPVYKQEGARILLMMLAARRPLEILAFRFIDTECGPPFRYDMGIAGMDESTSRQNQFASRLKAYTGHLVDFVSVGKGAKAHTIHAVFSHTTVENYLLTKAAEDILQQNAGSGFAVHRYLCGTFLCQMEQLPVLPTGPSACEVSTTISFHRYLNEFAHYMRCHESDTHIADVELMAHLDALLAKQSSEAYHRWLTCPDKPFCRVPLLSSYSRGSVVALAVQHGLCHYVSWRLDRDPALIFGRGQIQPLLRYALCPVQRNDGATSILSGDMVQLLLSRGASPNQSYLGMTPWSEFQNAISFHQHEMSYSIWHGGEVDRIAEILKRSGACTSPHLELRHSQHATTPVRLVCITLQPFDISVAESFASSFPLPPTNSFPPLEKISVSVYSWQSTALLLRSLRIACWLVYRLSVRYLYGMIYPDTLVDVTTILRCLAPTCVIFGVLLEWQDGIPWLGKSFLLANIVACLNCVYYSFWTKHPQGPRGMLWEHLLLLAEEESEDKQERRGGGDGLINDSNDVVNQLATFARDTMHGYGVILFGLAGIALCGGLLWWFRSETPCIPFPFFSADC